MTSQAMVWTCGVLALVVIAMTAYLYINGPDETATSQGKDSGSGTAESASPSESSSGYAPPEDWTEPERWVALPRGKRTDSHGNEVGFPHTTDGAIATVLASTNISVEEDRSTVDEHMGIYRSYFIASDQTTENAAASERNATKLDERLRSALGVPAEGGMPSGAYYRSHAVGYKILKKSPDEVSVYLLTRVTTKAGETKKEKGSYSRSVMGVVWDGTDWKQSLQAITDAVEEAGRDQRPTIGAPGDEAFNEAGWTAIREAS